MKSFFLYNINLFHDAYPRWIQPETSRSIQYPRQCACCRGDKKGVLYVHEFQRREIALSRWRGEISIFFAAISKTLLTPRDTNDSYPMPDSMARVISRFLHVRASTVSIISMFLISHQMSWTKWHRFLRVYIYISYHPTFLDHFTKIAINENTRVKELLLDIASKLFVWLGERYYFEFRWLERMVFWNTILRDSFVEQSSVEFNKLNS